MWDIHNHILADLDDGASCLEETMDMLDDAYDQGIRNIIFTPHYRSGMFEADAEKRRSVYRRVNELSQKSHPDMNLYLGCELHMHLDEDDRYKDTIYHMPADKVILTEFSTGDDFRSIRKILKPMLEDGYRCVIAHVERYQLNIEEIRKLHDMDGVFLQVNADSVLGKMGLRKKFFVWKLLKEELVDFIGSDAHNTERRTNNIGSCYTKIQKKLGKEKADIIFHNNPKRVFHP